MRRPISTPFASLITAALAAACSGPQSALDAAGPAAGRIAGLSWVMFAGAGAIAVAVMALAAYALLAPPERRRWASGRGLVIGGGLVFPVILLSILLPGSLTMVGGTSPAPPASFRIAIEGRQWWWRVTYMAPDRRPLFATANEIRIPVGSTVELELTAGDVIHSFWVPPLAGKVDMIPGHVNKMELTASREGVFRGQCAEYCGGAHALMALQAVAMAPEAFDAWMAGQSRPAAQPRSEVLRRGRALFLAAGCGACHTVRGTPAEGRIGPDLTHVGGRLTIGAGLLPTHAGTLAAWTADARHLKPEVAMPPFPAFSGEELRLLALWLESLE